MFLTDATLKDVENFVMSTREDVSSDETSSSDDSSESSDEMESIRYRPAMRGKEIIGFRSRYPKKEFRPKAADFQMTLKELGMLINFLLYLITTYF